MCFLMTTEIVLFGEEEKRRKRKKESIKHSSDAWIKTERQWVKVSYAELAKQHDKAADRGCDSEFPGKQPSLQHPVSALHLIQNCPAHTYCGSFSSVTKIVPVFQGIKLS